jgi:transcriptional regulator with GAF, ATPase, and Fis domain
VPTELHREILFNGAKLILRDPAEPTVLDSIPFGATSQTSASIMYVPICSGTKAVGILSIHSYTPGAYDQRDLEILQMLASQCSGALERLRADEELRKSESQFRLVWNTSADGMRLTNQDGMNSKENCYRSSIIRKTASVSCKRTAPNSRPRRRACIWKKK